MSKGLPVPQAYRTHPKLWESLDHKLQSQPWELMLCSLTIILSLCKVLWVKVESLRELVAFWFFQPLPVPFHSPFSPLICVCSGRLSEWSGLAKRLLSWEERRAPPTPRPAAPGPAHSNTGRKQRSLDSMKRRGTAEALGRTRKKEKRRGKRYLGVKVTFLLWLCNARHKHAHAQIPMYSGRQSRGRGVGLQPVCTWGRVSSRGCYFNRERAAVIIQQAPREKDPTEKHRIPNPPLLSLAW